ncbi:hypothetical protein AVDCRST_MAG94-4077, partial [uncultured Leptolyngbya sp.]
ELATQRISALDLNVCPPIFQ